MAHCWRHFAVGNVLYRTDVQTKSDIDVFNYAGINNCQSAF